MTEHDIQKSSITERAILVGLEISRRTAAQLPAAQRARAAAEMQASHNTTEDDSESVVADPSPLPSLPAAQQEKSAQESADASRPFAGSELLAEFRELVLSAGAEIVAEVTQRRPQPDAATLIGAGKVEEIRGMVQRYAADLVLFDHELTPTQFRNLEKLLQCRVLDRTQLILDIFASRARTREGHLQVECAQLEYLLPRLAGQGRMMSQLGGGIGTRGPGETQLEMDRRRIQRRLVHLRRQLEDVRRVRRQQRQRREAVPVPTVALVGYTNAGKSTLFRQLTGADVLASSRMFATLDPKLRAIGLPSRRRVLLSDTVGFIRNLPHMLVTSFRATLEEVEQAELLLHVRDLSSPDFLEQKAQVERVLGELGALDIPRIEVWNKADLVPQAHIDEALHDEAPTEEVRIEAARTDRECPPRAVTVSARTGAGMPALLEAIDAALTSDPIQETELEMGQAEGAALAALEAGAVILSREYVGDRVHVRVRAPASLLGWLAKSRKPMREDSSGSEA